MPLVTLGFIEGAGGPPGQLASMILSAWIWTLLFFVLFGTDSGDDLAMADGTSGKRPSLLDLDMQASFTLLEEPDFNLMDFEPPATSTQDGTVSESGDSAVDKVAADIILSRINLLFCSAVTDLYHLSAACCYDKGLFYVFSG